MSVSLSGRLAEFGGRQLLAFLGGAPSTGILELDGPEGSGFLFVREGDVVAAETDGLEGEVAAVIALCWTQGDFVFHSSNAEGFPDKNVALSAAELCNEVARLIREAGQDDIRFVPTTQAWLRCPLNRGQQQVLSNLTGPMNLEELASACGLPLAGVLFCAEELVRIGAAERIEALVQSPNEAESAPIRLLMADDSRLMQKVMRRLYETDPLIEVVGVASNGKEVLEMLGELKPDVVALDLHMPVMDGVTTLKHIMLSQPTPTVIVTAARSDGLEATFESILRFGAIDFITKPAKGEKGVRAESITKRLRKAAKANLRGIRVVQPPTTTTARKAPQGDCRGVIAAVGGTGGCLSFMQLITSLPSSLGRAVVGTLGFPQSMMPALVRYLNKSGALEVRLAEHGTRLRGGTCYLSSELDRISVEMTSTGPVLIQSPEGDLSSGVPLLTSVAEAFGQSSIGLLLSGDGDEALPGFEAIRSVGGVTMVQDPTSCVDSEQVERAVENGLVDRVVSLSELSECLSEEMAGRSFKIASAVNDNEGERPCQSGGAR